MKHTPGPWEHQSDYNAASGELLYAIRKGEQFVASGAMEDDARLIAAAPDLLEALRECERVLGAMHKDGWPVGGNVLQQARAAIAKATNPD